MTWREGFSPPKHFGVAHGRAPYGTADIPNRLNNLINKRWLAHDTF